MEWVALQPYDASVEETGGDVRFGSGNVSMCNWDPRDGGGGGEGLMPSAVYSYMREPRY